MSVEATIASPVVSGTSTNASTTSASSTATAGIADNFQTFLTLLTTQLQNQNPLDPLDTNQFTQQLVQFAGVEQQLRQNDQLKTLIAIEKSSQSTQALAYVGNTVAVDGSKAQFDGTGATWNINAPAESNVSITITSATGQTAFSGSYSVSQGNSSFGWDGKGNDGTQWPKGSYTMTAVGNRPTRPTRSSAWCARTPVPARRKPEAPLRYLSLTGESAAWRPRDAGLASIFKEIRIEALGLGKF